jgi:hypothetical protein
MIYEEVELGKKYILNIDEHESDLRSFSLGSIYRERDVYHGQIVEVRDFYYPRNGINLTFLNDEIPEKAHGFYWPPHCLREYNPDFEFEVGQYYVCRPINEINVDVHPTFILDMEKYCGKKLKCVVAGGNLGTLQFNSDHKRYTYNKDWVIPVNLIAPKLKRIKVTNIFDTWSKSCEQKTS